MTVYIIVNVARQMEGEYVFVQSEKGFTSREAAEAYYRDKQKVWRESIQGVTCECERVIHEVVID